MPYQGQLRAGRQRVLAALVASAEPDLARFGATGVSVALATQDQLVQLAYSAGSKGRELFELQRTLGEGPTLSAAARGIPIVAHLFDERDDVWVIFGREARAMGIDTVYAIPLSTGGARVGALTVHSGDLEDSHPSGDMHDRPNPMQGIATRTRDLARPGDNPLPALLRLADQLLLALLAPPDAPAETADTGIFSTVTHQAAGMVSVQLNVPIVDAIVTLQAEAYASGRDLVAVSREVVARRFRFHTDGAELFAPPAQDGNTTRNPHKETGPDHEQ